MRSYARYQRPGVSPGEDSTVFTKFSNASLTPSAYEPLPQRSPLPSFAVTSGHLGLVDLSLPLPRGLSSWGSSDATPDPGVVQKLGCQGPQQCRPYNPGYLEKPMAAMSNHQTTDRAESWPSLTLLIIDGETEAQLGRDSG